MLIGGDEEQLYESERIPVSHVQSSKKIEIPIEETYRKLNLRKSYLERSKFLNSNGQEVYNPSLHTSEEAKKIQKLIDIEN